ncbi:MAG: ABC transporter permease [Solirubrobacterales bacterium]
MSRFALDRRRSRNLALEVGVSLAIVAGVWIYTAHNHTYAIPALSEVLDRFREAWLFSRVGTDLVPTLERFAIGYLLAIVLGIPLGLALGSSVILRATVEPVLTFVRSIPPVALIPPAIILFGIGETTKLLIVLIVSLWPIVLNTLDGLVELDATLMATMTSLRLGRRDRFRYVILPALAPRILTGMRTSMVFALVVVIASEYLAGTNGVGFFIQQAQQTFDAANMWAGVLLLGIIGYILTLGLNVLERRILFWQKAR